MNHFLSIVESSPQEIRHVLEVAFDLRQQRLEGTPHEPILWRKTLAMIFEKPSLRTRVSFEQAMLDLGGHAILLRSAEVGLGSRESPADVAQVLSGMVHGIMARVYEHQKLADLAVHSSVPVINALSDRSHPCQVLADVMTLMDEFGRDLTGKTLAYVGDGNNVARSLAMICGKLGVRFNLGAPSGYDFDRRVHQEAAVSSPRPAIHDDRRSPPGRQRRRRDLHRYLGFDGSGKTRPPPAERCSPTIRSTAGCSTPPRRTRWCCTVCPPTATWRSPTK